MGTCSSNDSRTLKKDWVSKHKEQLKKSFRRLDVSSDGFTQELVAEKIFRRFNKNVKDDKLDLEEVIKLIKYALHKNGVHQRAEKIGIDDARILIFKMTGQSKDYLTKEEFITFVEWVCQNERFSSLIWTFIFKYNQKDVTFLRAYHKNMKPLQSRYNSMIEMDLVPSTKSLPSILSKIQPEQLQIVDFKIVEGRRKYKLIWESKEGVMFKW